MKTTKPTKVSDPWTRFLAALDANDKTGAVVRRWVNAGCDLRLIYNYASVSFSPALAVKVDGFATGQQERGKQVKAGLRKAIKGLEAVAKAYEVELQTSEPDFLGAARAEAEQMAEQLRQRLRNANVAYSRTRPGASQHCDPASLVALRQYLAARAEQPSHDVILSVARLAAVAWGKELAFDKHLEAARRAMMRLENGDPLLMKAMRQSAGGSRW